MLVSARCAISRGPLFAHRRRLAGELQHRVGDRERFGHLGACGEKNPAAEQRREAPRIVAELLAQLLRPGIGLADLRRGEAARRDQGGAQRGLQAELGAAAMRARRKALQQGQRLAEVRDRLLGRAARHREVARLAPELDRLLVEPGLCVVIGDQLGIGLHDLGKIGGQRARDAAVDLLAARPQQRVVGGLLHQGVLEGVGGVRRIAAPEHEARLGQLVERALQLVLGQPGDRFEQLVGELAADHRRDLRYVLDRDQPVEARHQRILQGRRDRQPVEPAGQDPAIAPIGQEIRIQHRLGQLLDEQRHALGLGHDLVGERCGQGLVRRHLRHQRGALPLAERRQRECREPRAAGMRRCRLRSRRDDHEDRQGGDPVDQQLQKLHRRRVDPMHVLDHDQQRPARRHALDPRAPAPRAGAPCADAATA